MRAKLITTVLSAAFMAGAAQIVAVAEPANTPTTRPAASDTDLDVKPVGRPQVDAATSAREKQLVGAKVISVDDKETGKVEKIIEEDGATKAVVEYEGLLGVGDKRVAIPIAEFTLIAEGRARVSLSEAEIKDLPTFEG